MLKVKVCGMVDALNTFEVDQLCPDFLGFIFYPQSPRYVGSNFQIPKIGTAKRVGVFVNQPIGYVMGQIKRHHLDGVQLHGSELAEYAEEIKQLGVTVIKAFSIHNGFDFRPLSTYNAAVDYFLFDAKGEHFGGNGVAFDWDILNQYVGSIPFFLSGGISLVNIYQAFNVRHPLIAGVDVNSGVEVKPGFKDIDKVRSIIQIIRN